MGTIKERVYEFCSEMGIKIRDFERACDLSNGYVSSMRTGFGHGKLNNVLSAYPNLNRDWLLYGEGEMLRPSVTVPTETQPRDDREMTDPNTKELRRNYEGTAEQENLPAGYKKLPLVTQTAVAGFGNANFVIHEADVKEYYVVPKFRYHQVDFMIEISGSSMYPKYNSGDVVACTILHDGAFIQWNKCHIVATREQGILCKRLMPGSTDDRLKMVSDNENYPPFEVPKDEITGIALVVGVIRLE